MFPLVRKRNTLGWKRWERERRKRGNFFRILNVQPAPSRIRSESLTFTEEPSFRVSLSLSRRESWSIHGVETSICGKWWIDVRHGLILYLINIFKVTLVLNKYFNRDLLDTLNWKWNCICLSSPSSVIIDTINYLME